MTTVYLSFDRAARRVDVLRQSGIWPGIRCHADGTFTLTFDPAEYDGDG